MDRKKIGITIAASIFCLLMICYFGIAFYFDQVFCPNTTINGIDVSMQKVSDVQKVLEENQDNYHLRVVTIEGDSELLLGSTFDFNYIFDGVAELKKREMGWQWPVKLFAHTDYIFEPDWEYNHAKLKAEISKLNCLTQEMTAPTNASIVIDEYSFSLQKETLGNTLEVEPTKAIIAQAVEAGERKIDLVAANCYEKPTITLESKEIRDVLNEVDKLCQAEITYDFRGEKEVIGTEQIRTWVRKNWDGSYYLSWDAAYAFMKQLAAKYDTVYTYREFKNSWGDVITLQPGNYGWSMAVYTETDKIMDDVANQRVITREPDYNMTPFNGLNSDAADDIGDSYVEMDLSSQYMWYYLDGELFLETPITSGTMYAGMGTPAGVYFIHNRLQNTILVGDDYRTPVNYWMQINGGIGIHDSLWRYAYGGTEYLYNGSHGCINTPYDAVESLFWNIEVGVPVVIYY